MACCQVRNYVGLGFSPAGTGRVKCCCVLRKVQLAQFERTHVLLVWRDNR